MEGRHVGLDFHDLLIEALMLGQCPENLPIRVVKPTDAEAFEAQCVELSVVGNYFLCWYVTREMSVLQEESQHPCSQRSTQTRGVRRVPYQIMIARTDDATRFLANRRSADCGVGVKCAPTELCLPLIH
jgi:hypothetical protein